MSQSDKILERRKKRAQAKKYQRKTYRPTERMRMCLAAIKTIPNVYDMDLFEMHKLLTDFGFTPEEQYAARVQAKIEGVI